MAQNEKLCESFSDSFFFPPASSSNVIFFWSLRIEIKERKDQRGKKLRSSRNPVIRASERGLKVSCHLGGCFRRLAVPPRPFAHLQTLAIRDELLRFGRRRAHENASLAPLLDELIARRFDSSRRLVLTDACYLAHSTGLYARTVELFLSCARETAVEMHLHECVVDSCFQLGSDFLPRLFDVLDLMVVRIRRDACSQLAVFRAFWLCCVALRDAQALQHEAGQGRRRVAPLMVEPAEYRKACERLHDIISKSVSTTGGNKDLEGARVFVPPLETLLRETMMCIRHASGGDDGEAAFYRRVIFARFVLLRHEEWMGSGIKARAGIFVSLIRSTQRAVEVNTAREYLQHFRLVWSEQHLPMDEQVIHMYFQTLAGAKAFEEIALDATNFIDTSAAAAAAAGDSRLAYTPSNSVVAVVIRAAGELRRLDLCLWCVDVLLSGGAEKAPPSPYEMFTTLVALAKCTAPNFFEILHSCSTADLVRLSEEELLYVRLQYVRNSVDAKERIEQLPEAIMLLTSSRSHSHHLSGSSSNNVVHDDARDEAVVLSTRNKNLILHILQVCDSDKFLPVLHAFCGQLRSLGDADRSWGGLALAWINGRRGTATEKDRHFVRTLLESLGMLSVSSPDAEPYRPALMTFLAVDEKQPEPPASPVFRPFTKLRGACLDTAVRGLVSGSGSSGVASKMSSELEVQLRELALGNDNDERDGCGRRRLGAEVVGQQLLLHELRLLQQSASQMEA
jgi:hypothetical protein